MRGLHQSPPLRDQGIPWKRRKRVVGLEDRWDGRHRENKALLNNWAKLIRTHRDDSSTHRTYSGLRHVLCVYTAAFSVVLSRNSWVCKQVGIWLLWFLLGLFYFSVVLSCPVLLYFIIFILFLFLFLESLHVNSCKSRKKGINNK